MAAVAPSHHENSPARTRLLILLLLIVASLVIFLVHVGWSTQIISPARVIQEVLRGPSAEGSTQNLVVWQLRLGRACACVLAGGLLGVVGSCFQALLRNPLADPYIVGVSSGAALGTVGAQLFGFAGALAGLAGPLAGTGTGILSLLFVFAIASRRRSLDVTTLLLAGVVVGSLLSAILSFGLLMAGQDTNQLLRSLLGSTSPMDWNRVAIMAGALVLGTIVLFRQTRALNVFAVGEETAHRLGVDTGRLKWVVLVTGTVMTAAAVGAVGIIGFVGLVAPHISRKLLGVDWRYSMIGSLLVGSVLLLTADVIAQRAFQNTAVIEMPVGIVTAMVGAPFLLALLRRRT